VEEGSYPNVRLDLLMRYSALTALLLLTACTSSATQPTGTSHTRTRPHSTSRPAHSTPQSSSASTPATSLAQRIFARMSERQRVGQLLMAACPTTGVAAATINAITVDHVGSVILDGTSYAGLRATRTVTDQLQRLAPGSVGLFISTDQEGGLVQRLQGPGF